MEEKSAIMEKRRAIREKILLLKKIAKQDNIGQVENEDVHEEAAQNSARGRNMDKKKRKLVDDDEPKETYSVSHKKDEQETCPPKVYKEKDICIERKNIFQQFPFLKKDCEILFRDIHGKDPGQMTYKENLIAVYESLTSQIPNPPMLSEERLREVLDKVKPANGDVKPEEAAVRSNLIRRLHDKDIFKSELSKRGADTKEV